MNLILSKNDKEKNLIAVSKIFARAQKQMNAAEFKTFIAALTKIKFTETDNSNIVVLDKRKLAKLCGFKGDDAHLTSDFKRAIGSLAEHSHISISIKDKIKWGHGLLVSHVEEITRGPIRIHLNPYYMPLFQGLADNYITLFPSDIFPMKSSRTIVFYENLKLSSDTRQNVCTKTFSIDCLKKLFDIPNKGNGSYLDKEGKFDVKSFEKSVIQPLISDMEHCKMIKLIMNQDGKYYEKIKEYGKIVGFSFSWKVKRFNKRKKIQPVETICTKKIGCKRKFDKYDGCTLDTLRKIIEKTGAEFASPIDENI